MEQLTLIGWVVCGLAVLLTGISKSAFAGALGGLGIPLMAIWMSPSVAVAVMLPMLCIMDMFGIRFFWKKWSVHDLKILLPGGIFGIVLGSFAIGFLSDHIVKGIIGAIAVLFMLDRLFKIRDRLRVNGMPGPVTGSVCGTLSGITSTMAHAGGPPFLIYLMGRRLPKETFVATSTVFFTIMNAAKIVPYAAMGLFSTEILLMALLLSPLAPLGVWLGVRVLRALPEKPFYFSAVVLLGLSGVKLLLDAFS